MFLFFIAVYLAIALLVFILIRAMVAAVKRDDEERGYDLPEDYISPFE